MAVESKEFGISNRSGVGFIVDDALTSLPLIVSDLIAITTAWILSASLHRILIQPETAFDTSILAISIILFPFAFFLTRSYPGVNVDASRELQNIVAAVTIGSLGTISFLLASQGTTVVDGFVVHLLFIGLLLVLAPIGRSVSRKFGSNFDWWRQRTLIIGGDAEVLRIANWLEDSPELGLRAIVPCELSRSENAYPNRVIFASSPGCFDNDLLWRFPRTTVLSTDDVFRASTAPERIAALSLITQENRLLNPSNQVLKRSMDLFVALCLFTLTLPLLVAIALLVKLSSNGPVLYGHQRFGRNGRSFKMWKFRTMHVGAEKVLTKHLNENEDLRREWEQNKKLQRDPRVLPIGRLLRKTSLDELPQLWNIIVGEMSLVGPRPILIEEREKYSDVFQLYAMVRPGITGLWQVSGRNETMYVERLSYCRYYVLHWSIWLDLLILVRTVKTAMFCEGAY